jgi:acyl dehydratase
MSASGFTTRTGILDEEIAEVRQLIGKRLRIPQWNHEASIDTIRHYAYGLGDDNPLWCDEDYAQRSRFGGIVAPPTFPYSVFPAGIGPGLPGLQPFQAGGRWDFKRYIKLGERLVPEATLLDVQELQGRRAGRMILMLGEVIYRTAAGEEVARNMSRQFRIARKGADSTSGLQYAARSQDWTEAELDEMEDQICAYRRRGAEARYWEDVQIGESLPTRLKGPMNIQTLMAYYAGNLAGGMYRATDIQVRHRRLCLAHPELVPNCRPIVAQTERIAYGQGHVDSKVAADVGMPGVYDNGWMRVGWCQQILTDWMGDDGFLETFDSTIHLPNIVGDIVRFNGRVTGKRSETGKHLVDVEFRGERQDGELSVKGTGTITLPVRGN